MIKFIWKIYTKNVRYDQKIRDEFEYKLVKYFEMKMYEHRLLADKNVANFGGDHPDWLGFDDGRASAFKDIWNDFNDRYFSICKKLNRLDEFYALRDSRIKELGGESFTANGNGGIR